jgi:hypothetical protein
VSVFDDTWEIGGRPYSARELSIGEAKELARLAAAPDASMVEAFDALTRQLIYLLRGPDGEAPSEEALDRDLSLPEALKIVTSIGGDV